jgi:KDO2-lipid IV(A) lauroyltransferase
LKGVLIKLVLHFGAILPLPVLHFLAVLVGWGFYLVPNRHRRVTEINLRLCFPQLFPRERRGLVRRSLIETAKSFMESPKVLLYSPRRVMALVRSVRGLELVELAIGAGKGVIMMGPHLGNWEIGALYCSYRYPITSMYRPQRNATINQLMLAGRRGFNAHMVAADAQGLRAQLQALRRGEMIGTLPDHSPAKGGGLFAPLFGVLAYSPLVAARLAQKTGAAVLYGCAERRSWGRGFDIVFYEAGQGIYDPDIQVAVTSMNRDMESLIRAHPEQYWWSYKRFRRRPPGEPKLY